MCLAEQTVSERHAALNIKQLKSTRKILASIRDEGSKNGIYVNDEELDYDAHEVKNHDIITTGATISECAAELSLSGARPASIGFITLGATVKKS